MNHRSAAKAATRQVAEQFPFSQYVPAEDGANEAFVNIAATAAQYVRPGGKILDFGSGPCDKTAVLALMGFECVAYDDLNDYWHREGDNLERLMQFASDLDVDLRLAEENELKDLGDDFDLVMSHDVFEHLHDSPRLILNSLLGRLREGGMLYLSIPNAVNLRKRLAVAMGQSNHAPYSDYFWHPGESWRGHVREYVLNDLVALADFCGLESVEIRGCDHMLSSLPGGKIGRRLWTTVTGPRRMHGFKDSVQIVAKKPANWSEIEIPAELEESFLKVGGTSFH